MIAGLGWLVVPRILEQLAALTEAIPTHVQGVWDWVRGLVEPYPALAERLTAPGDGGGPALAVPSLGWSRGSSGATRSPFSRL